MVFSTISFLFLVLPAFLLCDALARRYCGIAARNIVLTGISIAFYSWGEPQNVLVLLLYSLLNYCTGLLLSRNNSPRLLALGIAGNLAGLVYFKYAFWLCALFSSAVLNPLLHFRLTIPQAPALPLGISFFTFHAISYLVDVSRNKVAPARSAQEFFAYFTMFPHLVAGPIVRYAQVERHLRQRGPDKALFAFGLYRFLLGLNKKVLIANAVAPFADNAFEAAGTAAGLAASDAWLGMLGYALQIYFDFSGYSDMAVGLAAMAGFRFAENFLGPYQATSITDFWRRWHVSLSTWLRDYVYIPLGGNRRGRARTLCNLLITFLLCGLWHGANLTFLAWGLWHGLLLLVERLGLTERLKAWPALFSRGYTLLAVLLGWVLFRAPSLGNARQYFKALSGLGGALPHLPYSFPLALAALLAGALIALRPARLFRSAGSETPEDFSTLAFAAQACLAGLSVGMLLLGSSNPFIYYNF